MKRAALHTSFWLAYLVQDILLIFLLNTTRVHRPTPTILLLSFENCLVVLLPKLIFTYFILDVTLSRIVNVSTRKTAVFYSVIALIISILYYRLLAVYYVDPYIYHWTGPSSSFFYPLSFPVALMDIGFVSGAAIAIKLIRQQIDRAKMEQVLMKEKLQTELKYLKNQTNPHFLFNTLNNIYALARKKSDYTAEAVMKLSKLLRFMLYDTAKPLIYISDEVKMLRDYIDLEKIRYSDRLALDFAVEIDDEKQQIAPLLLLPFVENAFKHGASESRFDSFIRIKILLENDILKLTVENTKEATRTDTQASTIGLSNVRRQLELLYSDYDLQVRNEAAIFTIVLTINLSSYANDALHYN
jgi:sensor histidine kinase YesM